MSQEELLIGKMKLGGAKKARGTNTSCANARSGKVSTNALRDCLRELRIDVIEKKSLERYKLLKVESRRDEIHTLADEEKKLDESFYRYGMIIFEGLNLLNGLIILSITTALLALSTYTNFLLADGSPQVEIISLRILIYGTIATFFLYILKLLLKPVTKKAVTRLNNKLDLLSKRTSECHKIEWHKLRIEVYNKLTDAPKVPDEVLKILSYVCSSLNGVQVLIECAGTHQQKEKRGKIYFKYEDGSIVWVQLGKEKFALSVFNKDGTEISSSV